MRGRAARWRTGMSGVVAACVLAIAAAPQPGSGGTVLSPSRAGALLSGCCELPSGSRELISRTLGRDDARFYLHRRGARLVARAGRLSLSYGHSAGLLLRSGRMVWAAGLAAIGRGGRLRPTATPSVSAVRDLLTLARPGVREWYLAGPLGIEQGFTIAQAPAGDRAAPLTLSLGLPTGVPVRVTTGGESVLVGALRYSGLNAVDADGRQLATTMRARGGSLLLEIADRGARYPLRVDPFVQSSTLTAFGGEQNDGLGISVAISGDGSTIVAGAEEANASMGAAYVFGRAPSGWRSSTQVSELTASDGAVGDQFGDSVGVSEDGSVVIVGSQNHTPSNAVDQEGAAYVFDRPGGGWTNPTDTQTTELTESSGSMYDRLGSAVAISPDGTSAAVGAYNEQVGSTQISTHSGQGAVYLFINSAGGWSQSVLYAAGGVAGDEYGDSVSMPDDTDIIGGAPGAGSGEGAVYEYHNHRLGMFTIWSDSELTAGDASTGDRLGTSVAAGGGVIVGGAPDASGSKGAAYVFVEPSGGWANMTATGILTVSGAASDLSLGESVAISADGSTIVAGRPGTSSLLTPATTAGSAYAFHEPSGGWASGSDGEELTPSTSATNDAFGWAVAISADGSTIAGGSPHATVATSTKQGTVSTFAASSTTALNCQSPSVPVGAPDVCTATVTDGGSGTATPTGAVSFGTDSGGSFGGGAACTLAAAATAGIASCSLSYTPTAADSGTHTLSASYGGDVGHAGSQNTTHLSVSRSTTSTSISCSPSPLPVGATSTCTVAVTAGAATPSSPVGTVTVLSNAAGTFSGGGSCTLAAEGSQGTASCTVGYTPTAVGPGTHRLTAAYAGTAAFTASLGMGNVDVALASTQTLLSCTPLSIAVGHPTRCSVTVTTAAGTLAPSGSVSFASSGAGTFAAGGSCTLLAQATTGAASCSVSYAPSSAGVASPKLTATYHGDSEHFSSQDSALVAVTASGLPRVKVGKPTLKGASVLLLLSCPATEQRCQGTVSIRHGKQLLGSARFRIVGGKTTRVKIKLSAGAVAALGGALKVAVTVIARDQAGRSATTTETATLKPTRVGGKRNR